MKKSNKTVLIILPFLLLACGDGENKISEDESHNPQDWSNQIECNLQHDNLNDAQELIQISAFDQSSNFEGFVDQLFQLAFSGDANIYGVDFLGEMDESMPLDPDKLLAYLRKIDSVQIEDILTGEMVDTTVDLSFSRSQTSAVIIYFNAEERDLELKCEPFAIALGKLVFDDETGERRGIQNKFVIKLNNNKLSDLAAIQRLNILSDSNGVYYPAFLDYYHNEPQSPFQDLLERYIPVENGLMRSTINLDFEYRPQILRMAIKRSINTEA